MDIPENQEQPQNKNFQFIKGFAIALILFGVIFALYFSKNINIIQESHPAATQQTTNNVNPQELIQGAVVHIDCPYADNINFDSLGSGTIISSDGLIITNAHVIPHDDSYLNTLPGGCLVFLPDPKTGMILLNKSYIAAPKIIKGIGDKYDLATLQIYDVAGSDVTKKINMLPSTFPSFDISKGCLLDEIKLGDKIHIYGYPDTGGNSLSLTLTEGLVSSFPGDGNILTDAKINHGSSGGLAINEKGCFIGIPFAGYEGYGYIISTDLISAFQKETEKNSEFLNDESKRIRKMIRENIDGFYGDAPYFIKFVDEKPGSVGRITSGSSEKFIILLEGNNDNDLESASMIAFSSLDDEPSITRAFYVIKEFFDVIDDRLLKNDENLLKDMLQEIINNGGSSERIVDGLRITFGYSDKFKGFIVVFEKADSSISINSENNTPYPGYSITYKPNNYDANVEKIQTQLNTLGYKVTVDGYFGPQTLAAVKDFQTKNGLASDGVVGIKTWEALFNKKLAPQTTTQVNIVTDPANTLGLTAPVTIKFDGTKLPIDTKKYQILSFLWDFGDGQTSTVQSPSHTYANMGKNNGRFDVKVDVTLHDSAGKETVQTFTTIVTIANVKLNADFTATPDTGPAPLDVSFDASASSAPAGEIQAYDWDFDNNNTFTDATGSTTTHTFEQVGTYTVNLRVTDNTGQFAIVSQKINVR